MLQGERIEKVMQIISEKNFVEVEELARIMNVSPMTIRRDLNKLSEKGLIERCHGGARLPQGINAEKTLEAKQMVNCNEKKRIAAAAVKLIQNEETIFLDSGTTTNEIANLLKTSSKEIAVITNDLNIAQILTDSSSIEVVIVGGIVQKKTKSIIGQVGSVFLRQFRMSKAFIGAPSIDYEYNVLTPTMEKAYLKQTVMELSAQSYLVVDSSKFYNQSMFRICHLSDFTGVITDKRFSDTELKRINESNINIIYA